MTVYPGNPFAGISIKPLPKPIIIILMVGAAIHCARYKLNGTTFTSVSNLGLSSSPSPNISLAPAWERVRVRGCFHCHMVLRSSMSVYPGNTVSRIKTVNRGSLGDVELGSC